VGNHRCRSTGSLSNANIPKMQSWTRRSDFQRTDRSNASTTRASPFREALFGTVVTGVKAALNIILKRLRAPTRGTLMLTKRTGGNVLLYCPILMESLAPGNKGLLSPGPGEDMLSSGKVSLKVTGPGAVLCFQLCCSAHFMVPKAGPCRCRLAGEENWHPSDSWLVDLDRASARRFKSTGLI